MSHEADLVKPAVLLTIIGETVLKEAIIKMLKSYNVIDYTITQVQGEGSHGRRTGDMVGYNTNIEIKTILSLEASNDILQSIKDYQGKQAVIAFRSHVEVLS